MSIPDSVTFLGRGSLSCCSALTNVHIGKGITKIRQGTFGACANLETFEIPQGVTAIGCQAFSYSLKLRSVTIPASVTAIGDEVFKECPSFKAINGYTGSYAEKYTSKYNYNFNSLGKNISTDYSGLYAGFDRSRIYDDNLFSDVKKGDWYSSYIKSAYEISLIDGAGNGTFCPNGKITLAQVLKIACIVRSTYEGYDGGFTLKTTPWYQVYLKYALTDGIVTDGEFTNWDAPATRAQMAYILVNAVPDDQLAAINAVKTLPDVKETDKYGTDIFTLYRAGVLTGSDSEGIFYSNSSITRAEAVAIVSRIIDTSLRIKTAL
jgi:hypothetical protein